MKVLLDTHILLWWLSGDRSLPQSARHVIAKESNTVFVSAATAWEISIKKAIGKLSAPDDLESALFASQFEVLPITIPHALAAGLLPNHHDDPFDRMLVAQARHEGMRLLTHDSRLGLYGDFVDFA